MGEHGQNLRLNRLAVSGSIESLGMTNESDQPTPRFVTCPCQYCNGGIEFDAASFAKGETRTVECPHCKLETLIFVPHQKAPPIVTPSNQQNETSQPFTSLSYKDSIELIRNAAEQGDARAQHWLAFRYINGEGVPADYSKAVIWLSKAAEQGFVESQIQLGFAYLEGMGLPRDYSKAVVWLGKAVEQGNAVAQNMLGCCYMEGEAIPKDYHKAALLFIKAAEQGNPDAQFNLAGCFINGWGVPQDSVDAYRYANLAAKQGKKAAIEMRDELSKKLSLSQITEGQRRTDSPKQTTPPPLKPQPQGNSSILTIGDIAITSEKVITPNGTGSLADSQWIFSDMSRTESRMPAIAVILAIVFALLCLIGLLFLLMRETTTTGYAEVSMHSGNLYHKVQIPISSKADVDRVRELVNKAQSLAAQARANK
jgi:hypothetical protein